MDSRSKKTRSLAADTRSLSQRHTDLVEQSHSASSTERHRRSQGHLSSQNQNQTQNQNKRLSTNNKSSDQSAKSPRTSTRPDIGASAAATHPSDRFKSVDSVRSGGPKLPIETDNITTFTFAILGDEGVGKTGFICNALDLPKSLSTPIASSKVSLSGKVYRIRLIELSFDEVEFTSGRKICWPRQLNSAPFPAIDGVYCLYDVSDEESVAFVPQALSALSNCGLPCMLVACKADIPVEQREVEPRFHEQVRRSFSNVYINESSREDPQSQKRCILSMLNRVLASTKVPASQKPHNESATRNSRSSIRTSRDAPSPHSRSRSRSKSRLRLSRSKDFLLSLAARAPIIESDNEESEDNSNSETAKQTTTRSALWVDTSQVPKTSPRPSPRPTIPRTPVSSGEMFAGQLSLPADLSKVGISEAPESYVTSMLRPGTSSTGDSQGFKTFLNMDDEPHDDDVSVSRNSEQQNIGLAITKLSIGEQARQDSGVPFKKLVERILELPASKQGSKFISSFMCLYRSFATPQQLLVAILRQFVAAEKSNMVHFTKAAEQLRYLQVLGSWTAQYPGDFADSTIRQIATTFIQSLEKSMIFAPAAREISNNLEIFVADDDLDWAFNEIKAPATAKSSPYVDKSTPSSSFSSIPSSASDSASKLPVTQEQTKIEGNSTDDEDGDKDNDDTEEEDDKDDDDGDDTEDDTEASTKASSVSRKTSSMLRAVNSSQSQQNLQMLEYARYQARRFRPNPHIRLSKVQWHQFMDAPVEDLAREITRIDWSMYSAIRPRDFVRHTVLNEQKRQSRSMDNISMMVQQFNHLTLFVSGMILLRDKPKHRVQALGKFMALAWKVRQLNNYNSLGAIVAGINGHAIARLGATWDLVPLEVQKQFMRLTILMSTSRSHAAYRMAWENSFQERIPYIPLLRQDLTMAATANPTFVGGNINWKKFEIMGDAIVSIQKSYETPYSFPSRSAKSDEIIKLVLETRIIEASENSEDPQGELYERSVQVEPQPGADPRKKFEWLRR